tara:strand:+ start:783 stop:971 length:189 start_codon:yes stop_codon:yes gene_type:complete
MKEKTYKELSLKQREQRKGYRETNLKDIEIGKEVVDEFAKIFSNDGKGTLIIDRNKDIKLKK